MERDGVQVQVFINKVSLKYCIILLFCSRIFFCAYCRGVVHMSLHLFGTCKGSSQKKISVQFNADLWCNFPAVCNNYWGDLCECPGQLWAKVQPCGGRCEGAGGTCASTRGSASDAGACYGQWCNPAEGDARVPGGLVRVPRAVPQTLGHVTGEGATLRREMQGCPGEVVQPHGVWFLRVHFVKHNIFENVDSQVLTFYNFEWYAIVFKAYET